MAMSDDRPAKRQRIEEQPLHQDSTSDQWVYGNPFYTEEPSIELLLSWLKEQAVWIDEDLLDIKPMDEGEGIAVFAKKGAAPQQVGE